MAHYIDKAAVVAEIEKRLNELYDSLPNASDVVNDNYTKDEANIIGKYTALESFSKFLDTLEVKEVDLDREIRRYRMRNPIIQHREESLYDYMANVAKHFFELGLKVNQKGE